MTPYEELVELDACPDAIEWIKKYPNLDRQGLWNICELPEWMMWLMRNGKYSVPTEILMEIAYEIAASALDCEKYIRDDLCDVLDLVSKNIDNNLDNQEKRKILPFNFSASGIAVFWSTSNKSHFNENDVSRTSSWASIATNTRYYREREIAFRAHCDIIRYFIPNLEAVRCMD